MDPKECELKCRAKNLICYDKKRHEMTVISSEVRFSQTCSNTEYSAANKSG